MFLQKHGSGGLFTFDVIYSCLQKSLRRGDITLSLYMAKEFKDYPGALKKRLIQNCCEDCPDLKLIIELYGVNDYNDLIKYIPIICRHIKYRGALWMFRIAVTMEPLSIPPPDISNYISQNDDMLTTCRKLYRLACEGREIEFVQWFVNKTDSPILMKIYKYLSSNRTFIFMLIATLYIDYIGENYSPLPADEKLINKILSISYIKNLPDYVYDRHVGCSPPNQKTYEFFINNLQLNPAKDEMDYEKYAKQLYITSNLSANAYVHKLVDGVERVTEPKKLLQTQLITAKHKPKVYYCSFDGINYTHCLKGPMDTINYEQFILPDVIKRLIGMNSPDTCLISINNIYYLCSNNLIPVDDTNVIISNSKLEHNVRLYNGDKYVLTDDKLKTLNDDEQLQLLKILLFRKFIGTNDTCNRNIIYYNSTFTSIDDPILLQSSAFMFKKKLNKDIAAIYNSMHKKHHDVLMEWLDNCINIISGSSIANNYKQFIISTINKFKNNEGIIF